MEVVKAHSGEDNPSSTPEKQRGEPLDRSFTVRNGTVIGEYVF